MLAQKLSRIELKEGDFDEYLLKNKTPLKETENDKKQTPDGRQKPLQRSTPTSN